MNTTQNRVATLAAFILLQLVHSALKFDETPFWMFAYHGSAALCDLAAIYITGILLAGKLAEEIHAINVASIALNGVGWVAYMAYIDPVWYNTAMTALIITSYLRLIMIGGGDATSPRDTVRRWVVRMPANSGRQPHQKEATV